MKRTFKGFLAFTAIIGAFFTALPAMAATYPNQADAVTLGNAINNNTQAQRNVGSNNSTIALYLPRMFDCQPVYTVAADAMDALIGYVAGGGTDVNVKNGYIDQVNQALAAGKSCAGITARPAIDTFNANGVKYTNVGWATSTFVNQIVTTTNNMPTALRANLLAAYAAGAGWKFYIYRTPEDFQKSPLYTSLGVTPAQFLQYRSHPAATIAGANVQIFFQYSYPSTTSTQLESFVTSTNPTATVAHENEHIKDIRLSLVSKNDSGFIAAYNAGVTAYNNDPAHNTKIGDAFVADPVIGRSELFAELAAYWDTTPPHWAVSGVTSNMSSKLYSSADVLRYFSSAWTYFQQKRNAGTW